MNRMTRMVVWSAACVGAAWAYGPTVALAAEGRERGIDGRFEQLERRLEHIAGQQEQMLRQLGGQAERFEQRFNQMAERQEQFMRQAGATAGRQGPRMQGPQQGVQPQPNVQPQPGPGPEGRVRGPMVAPGFPLAVQHMKGVHDALGLAFFCWILCNILLAVWIFTDIRKRGQGPAIFVALALIAGIPTAIIYALVRIGDNVGQVRITNSVGGSGAEETPSGAGGSPAK